MKNNIKIEPLTTEQKETLVSGLFSMMSKENTQFISKEKHDELEQYNMKLKDKVEQLQDRIDKSVGYIEKDLIPYGNEYHWDNASLEDSVNELLNILKGKE